MPPILLLWLPDALRDQGVHVVTVRGWEARTARRASGEPYPFDPVGVMNHHDAINEGVPATNVLKVMIEGRPAPKPLSGPLCNLWLDDDGICYVIAAGNANHAGWGSSAVLELVRAGRGPAIIPGVDDIVGNPYFVGIEVNDSDGVLDDRQIEALVRVNAAICAEQGWGANRCIHHREWTLRKPDMAWRGDLRGMVARRLAGPNEEDDMLAKDDTDLRRSWCREKVLWLWGREPTAAELDELAALLIAGRKDHVLAKIADAPAAVDLRRRRGW